jgi:hypothetical protein
VPEHRPTPQNSTPDSPEIDRTEIISRDNIDFRASVGHAV